jgi:hypothetical protein
MIINVFTMESTLLRAQKMNVVTGGHTGSAEALARLHVANAMDTVELAARKVLGACAEGDALRTQMAILRRLSKREPVDTITLSRRVARDIVKAGRYSVA